MAQKARSTDFSPSRGKRELHPIQGAWAGEQQPADRPATLPGGWGLEREVPHLPQPDRGACP
ncbi:MAG: hypothetical protein VKK80_08835 [Prochlorothrix sp.]|nr:hypothetical protein [Prochlorothrix sp.]